MDSKGTWTLAKEMSGAFMGLPCCWNDAGWNRGLPEPALQLLGKGTGGAPGAAAGSPAAASNGAELTEVGKAAPGNTEGVPRPWAAVLEERDRKTWEVELEAKQVFHHKPRGNSGSPGQSSGLEPGGSPDSAWSRVSRATGDELVGGSAFQAQVKKKSESHLGRGGQG